MILPPVAAAQPITGGMAPTIAPIHVFNSVCFFVYVYNPAYKPILARPNAATTGLVAAYNNAVPAKPVLAPNTVADVLDTFPDGRGRVKVRFIFESSDISKI